MRRDHCGGCQSAGLVPFLNLGSTPLADKFPFSANEGEKYYPLEIAVCSKCYLVQLLEVVPDEILWADYGFYSGASPSKVSYHKDYAKWVLDSWPTQAQKLVVEIGCNDGDLLRHFAAAGSPTIGIDPAKGPAEEARECWDLDVRTSLFDKNFATALEGQASVVIGNHVVAHTADLHEFFSNLELLLSDDGIAILEVQYLPDLLTGNMFDHFYHEHRYFFSVATLESVAKQHGLMVDGLLHTSQQGGSVRVVLKRGKDDEGYAGRHGWEDWLGLFDFRTYFAFESRVLYIRERLLAMMAELPGTIAGYGATAKSTTLLNFCGIEEDILEFIVDKTPAKIGRVTPGTHIPIVGEDDRPDPDTFLLLAWNYLAGVLQREQNFMNHGGKFLVPIPRPVLL